MLLVSIEIENHLNSVVVIIIVQKLTKYFGDDLVNAKIS